MCSKIALNNLILFLELIKMAQEFPLETHVFTAPCKKLFTQEDVNMFFESAPCANLIGYVQALQAAVKGKGRS